jgi:uncharacterized membrane protein SpoIIM required for sporulation
MKLDNFVLERQRSWGELDALVRAAGGRAERLGPAGVRRLGELYRAAAADLALARRRFAQEPITPRLDDLVARARRLVYDVKPREGSLLHFVTTGYWRRVRERPVPLVLAALLLFGPWILAAVWADRDPAAAQEAVPGSYRSIIRHRESGHSLGLSADEETAFSSQIFTNNIRVTFFVFAGGIAAGLGTALLLVYQGVLFGSITGLAVWAGNGRPFFELITAHGVLELSCIVVSGAAGFRLGWAMVDPGRRRRGAALAAEGRRSVEIVLGTMPWLVLAGIVEGFVTPAGLGLGPVLVIGLSLGALYWGLVLWRGRPERRPDAGPDRLDSPIGPAVRAALVSSP